MLRRERSLWSLALVPFGLSLLAFGLAVAGLAAWGGALHGFVVGWLPELHAQAWWAWLWVGPARALLFMLGNLLFAAVALACLVAAFLLAGLLASPFHDALSRRVERIVCGRVDEVEEPGLGAILREGGRALREELRRLTFFLALWAAIAVLGLVVPGGQVLAPPAMLGLTLLFLPLDYASYTLDRRRLDFAAKRAWLLGHAHAMLGFGAAAFLLCAVPVLNLLAMPILVVSGTLLALRYPLPPRAPGSEPGSATSP